VAVESWTEKAEKLIKDAGGELIRPEELKGVEP